MGNKKYMKQKVKEKESHFSTDQNEESIKIDLIDMYIYIAYPI